jgi:hypothetical protein
MLDQAELIGAKYQPKYQPKYQRCRRNGTTLFSKCLVAGERPLAATASNVANSVMVRASVMRNSMDITWSMTFSVRVRSTLRPFMET